MTVRSIAVRVELSVWTSWTDTPATVLKDTSEKSKHVTHSGIDFNLLHQHGPSSLSLYSGQLCEVLPSPLSLCELADCQNNAPCVERGGRALCQCPPEFGGPSCEKLVSVNFIDRDSYLLLSDLKNWPQANITLQVHEWDWIWRLCAHAAFLTPEYFKHPLQTWFFCRCPQLRIMASCCTMATTIILQWSSTKVMSRSAMTPAASQDIASTGELPLNQWGLLMKRCHLYFSYILRLISVSSSETINDGQFHTVELVTFDQMVNLSIDGGLPTTMDSFAVVRPHNGEAPLYVGGRGPLQNTPPSSAGTLNYSTTVYHLPPPPLRFVTTATNASPQPCIPSTLCYLHPHHPHPQSWLCLLGAAQ